MKKYIANQVIVLNNVRYDKGAALELSDKAAAPLLASDKVKAAETKAATKTAGKAAAKDTEVTA